jgi:hypothetical protein
MATLPTVPSVAVRILHAEASPSAGPLTAGLATVRRGLAERLADTFRAAGADDVAIVAGPPDDTPFGTRLSDIVPAAGAGGLIVAGSGSLAVARPSDLRPLVATAGLERPTVVANNRFSADVVAVARARYVLRDVPADLPSDNALPRWIEQHVGVNVADLAGRWRLAVDVDTPLDAVLVGAMAPPDGAPVASRLGAVATLMRDPLAELVVAGRTSARTMRWLERRTACQVRLLAEERGLRASTGSTLDVESTEGAGRHGRPPASVLGALLECIGAAALGSALPRLADAALIDTRPLLAHRLGAAESDWPTAEDRYASDLLLPDAVGDPWLKVLTAAAVAAPIPVVLGSHTLVGPGVRLVARWT